MTRRSYEPSVGGELDSGAVGSGTGGPQVSDKGGKTEKKESGIKDEMSQRKWSQGTNYVQVDREMIRGNVVVFIHQGTGQIIGYP